MKFVIKIAAIAAVAVCVILAVTYFLTGPGWLERSFTLSGIYAVERPDGYDVVCFGDSGHRDGGITCVPCSLANECKRGGK